MHTTTRLILAVLLVVLSACAAPGVQPLPTAAPSRAAATQPPADTATSAPASTAKPTATATMTPPPTATATATPVPVGTLSAELATRLAPTVVPTPAGAYSGIKGIAVLPLTNTLGGLGADYHASPRLIAVIGGIGVTAAGILGSLMIPLIGRAVGLLPAYVGVGIVGGLSTLSLLVLPHTPAVYTIGLVAQNIWQSAGLAAGTALILSSIGIKKGNLTVFWQIREQATSRIRRRCPRRLKIPACGNRRQLSPLSQHTEIGNHGEIQVQDASSEVGGDRENIPENRRLDPPVPEDIQ